MAQWGDEAAPARTWQFLSQPDLAAVAYAWTGPPYNPQNPQTVDDVLRMSSPGATYTVTNNGTWASGYYDSLAGIRTAPAQHPGPVQGQRASAGRGSGCAAPRSHLGGARRDQCLRGARAYLRLFPLLLRVQEIPYFPINRLSRARC